MTRLYFVRHGKTEWNLEGRYQGAHGDSPLLAQSYLETLEAFLGQLSQQYDKFLKITVMEE